MEEEYFAAECMLKMLLQESSHFGELREDERLVGDGDDLFEHLREAGKFAGPVCTARIVSEKMRGMIADLFQLRHCGKDESFSCYAGGIGKRLFHRIDYGGIERRLFPG